MQKNQLALIKESYMKSTTDRNGRNRTAGEYMRFCLDGGVEFVTSKDCVVFDDGNELLHCICINDDPKSQADFPIKVMSSEYAIIQQLETIMSKKNFEDFINNGFISSLLSDEKKKFILEWSKKINNQAQQPMEAEPYFAQTPKIIPMQSSTITRDDGIEHPYSPATLGPDFQGNIVVKVIGPGSNVKEAISKAEAGAVLLINESTITEEINLDKPVVLIGGNNATISAPVTVTNQATISGFTINPENSTNNAIIKVTGDGGLTLTNNTISTTGSIYNAVNATCSGPIVITNNVFESTNNGVHNVIEFSQDEKYKIKDLTISNNVFKAGACKNNNISMYYFEDDAVVNIENNLFEYAGNAVRVSNYSNAKNIQINCISNTYNATAEDLQYAGFVLFQAVKGEDFSNVSVLFKDIIGPEGIVLTENGTGLKQVWYTYNTDTVPNVKFAI